MTTTREAIREMHKRGYDGDQIIWIAKMEHAVFQMDATPADALVRLVKNTPNIRFCRNCNGPHYIQDCGEIKHWLNASNITFNKFMEENRL